MPNVPETRTYETINYNMFKYGFNDPTGGGGGEDYVEINSTGTLPVAGIDSIAIGENVDATGAGSVAIGTNASVPVGSGATLVGIRTSSAGANTVVLGADASATQGEGIAIGQNASSNSDQNISIGKDTSGTGICSIAIGTTASTNSAGAIAIGDTASATAVEAIQLGTGTNSTTQTLQFLGNTLADENGLKDVKKLLTVSLTYFVRTTGNDSNDGLSAGNAFLTVQKALEESCQYRLEEGVILEINVGAGTFTFPDNWDFNLENGIDGKLQIVGAGAGSTTLTSGATQNLIKSSGGQTQSLVNHVFRDLRFDGTGLWYWISIEFTCENCTFAAPFKVEDGKCTIVTGTLDYPASFGTAFILRQGRLAFNGVLTNTTVTNFTGWFVTVIDNSTVTFLPGYSLSGTASTGNKWLLRRFSFIQDEVGGLTEADIPGSVSGTLEANCQFFGSDLVGAFDDDADAGSGGLVAGQKYQTTGAGAAPLNVAGIVMVKQ